MNHPFTENILQILQSNFGEEAQEVYEKSSLLQYLNIKTRSANRGSKARGAFANHYALYVLVEDYIKKGFLEDNAEQYQKYLGARFSDLLRRQRQLPFGSKLQNHALNARLNDEFAKFFPTLEIRPILRDQREQRYWINENLLNVEISRSGNKETVNIAKAILQIIDAYVETKKSAFEAFLATCQEITGLSKTSPDKALEFISNQLQPNVDARIFEIISFAILKASYGEKSIFWGWSIDELQQDFLMLYKTGRTNANDGGIDFVMRPLGRFFQVTETIDVNKYFLDIDKIQRFPLTFVVKSLEDAQTIREKLRAQALQKYVVEAIVDKYLGCIEEIINISDLTTFLLQLVQQGKLQEVMDEVIIQSKVEFNYEEDFDESTS